MKKRTREMAPPDITPLIDVVFLLLIFFMVSTVFKKDELALLLNLPKTSKGQSVQKKEEKVLIELGPSNLAFNGKKVLLANFEGYIAKIIKKNIPIDLRIDKTVRYERIIKILDQLKKYELTNLSLITDN